MERWNGYVDDINATVDALGDKCNGLLGMHTLSGCDTASYPNAWKRKGVCLAHLIQSWGGECYAERPTDNRHCFLSVPLYCQKESTSLNAARQEIYRKSKRRNPPPLKSLPPTNANLTLHVHRAHLQMLLW